MGKIFYIMGKSASGKDKIYGRIAEELSQVIRPLVLYTTRPVRSGEIQGKQYHFVDREKLLELEKAGRVIERRDYHTMAGLWTYFTADDGQLDLEGGNYYLGIGTLESYAHLKQYFGEEKICPIYIEVEDGERLRRAVRREGKQEQPRYAEVCRRYLADEEDFAEEKIRGVGIVRRFENNGELEDCIAEIRNYILEEMRSPEDPETREA